MDSAPTIPILFPSVGRRVELLQAFREAARRRSRLVQIHGCDMNATAPALWHCDVRHRVPPIDSSDYLPAILEIVKTRRVQLVIPTLDPDLPPFARAVDAFKAAGSRIPISDACVVELCQDKLVMAEWLRERGFLTPRTWTLDQERRLKADSYPLFVKPRKGSAAKGTNRVERPEELGVLAAKVKEPLIQPFLAGNEFTLDVFSDGAAVPRFVTVRRRLEIRSGEVSKAVLEKDGKLENLGKRLAEALGGCRGVITVQVIRTAEGGDHVIEVNPRFGGGVPLAVAGGADYPGWILDELEGRTPAYGSVALRIGLVMTRYDQSVFITPEEIAGFG